MMASVDVAILDREIYSAAEAAQILRVPPLTLMWWLDGTSRDGKVYPPVIRPETTGKRTLTWAEFVEAGLLRQYRRDLGVKLQELRGFIDGLRDATQVPYPLAHYRPWVGEGQRLVLEVQRKSELPGELWLVAQTAGQLVLTGPADSFLRRVDWLDELPVAWRPHLDEDSPIRCLPTQRFGRPSIKGISTEALMEHLDADEDEQDVAEAFDLDIADVRWARSFEESRRAQLAAA